MSDDQFERFMMRGLGLTMLVIGWLLIAIIVFAMFGWLSGCKA